MVKHIKFDLRRLMSDDCPFAVRLILSSIGQPEETELRPAGESRYRRSPEARARRGQRS